MTILEMITLFMRIDRNNVTIPSVDPEAELRTRADRVTHRIEAVDVSAVAVVVRGRVVYPLTIADMMVAVVIDVSPSGTQLHRLRRQSSRSGMQAARTPGGLQRIDRLHQVSHRVLGLHPPALQLTPSCART